MLFEKEYFKLWSLIQSGMLLNRFIRLSTRCFPRAIRHCVEEAAAFFEK